LTAKAAAAMRIPAEAGPVEPTTATAKAVAEDTED
jgi:hypothetical protein